MTARTVGRPRKRGMVGGRERVRVGILFVVFTCICHSNILIEIYITCVLLREGVPTGPVLPGTGYTVCGKGKNYFSDIFNL